MLFDSCPCRRLFSLNVVEHMQRRRRPPTLQPLVHATPKRHQFVARFMAMPQTCPATAPAAPPGMTPAGFAAGFLLACVLFLVGALWWLLRRGTASGSLSDHGSKAIIAHQKQLATSAVTDGAAPKAGTLPDLVTFAPPRAPASVDATASPTTLVKGEETGYAGGTATAETLASAMSLVQRVRDLGLHLGDVVVTGYSLGLPNAETGRAVFAEDNVERLMRGDNLISRLPPDMMQAQLDRHVVQIHKDKAGNRIRKPLSAVDELIQLASRVGAFDLGAEFGVSSAICETLDTTYALAVGAGLEALRNAGLVEAPVAPTRSPPSEQPPAVAPEASSAGAWKLKREHRNETGVIFAASFPALDSLVEELARAMSAKLTAATVEARALWRGELQKLIEQRAAADAANPSEARSLGELSEWLTQQEASLQGDHDAQAGYEFNRKLLFRLLVMANSQLAEIVQAKGPNLHINAACAGTTAAIALAHDWMRTGRARRVVVISADNPSSDHLLPWVGIGFLALGAACIKRTVEEAALPFDRRRSGMLLGAGAVGLVLEADTTAALAHPTKAPLSTVLGVRHANSAYHASAIGVAHAAELLDGLLRDVEVVHGLRRSEIAPQLLYVSHETFTCARNGGCAGAEVTALRAAFGDADLKRILITNSKGITGHAMGVCFEDVVAVAALSTGLAPPVVHHKEDDPVLGPLRLSCGGPHECKYALHFAAGFGSQVTYILYRK